MKNWRKVPGKSGRSAGNINNVCIEDCRRTREDERRKKWFAAFVGTLLFVALKLGRIIEFDGIKAPPCFYNALNNITFDEIIKLDGSCANASEFVMLLRGGDYQIEV